jgi:hypothetical protein
MNRQLPRFANHQRGQESPNPAGTEHSMRSAVSSGEKENQANANVVRGGRACQRAFLAWDS